MTRSRSKPRAKPGPVNDRTERGAVQPSTGRRKAAVRLLRTSAARYAALALALSAATFVVYQPALRGRFLWDDERHVTAPQLQPLAGLRQIWLEPAVTQQYYPLLHTAFWLEHRAFGDQPMPYHAVNIALHVLAAVLLYAVVRQLGLSGAALAAAIFALHPVQVESVAWISELKNTLSAVCYLAAVLVYLRFDASRRWLWYAAAFGLFCLALLTKTVTATLPAAILVLLWWKRGRLDFRRDIRPVLPLLFLGAAAGLLSAWMERKLVGAEGGEFALSPLDRVFIAGRATWFYVGKLVWPAQLTFIYPRWQIDAGVWWQYLFPAAALALLIALFVLRRRARWPLAAALYFGGTLFPALGFVNVYPFRYSFVADHFQYLACIGLIVPVAAIAAWSARSRSMAVRGTALAASTGALIALALAAHEQSKTYVDSETLFRTTIERNPGCWMAYSNLGKTLAASAQLQEAIANYRKSLELKPDEIGTANNLGVALLLMGDNSLAADQFRHVLALAPDAADTRANLASALVGLGKPREAIDESERALAATPNSAIALNSLALALARVGRHDEARRQCLKALDHQPGFAPAYITLGNICSQSGQTSEALADYRRALAIDPRLAEAHNNLGSMLERSGKPNEAIAEYRAALQINPRLSTVHNNLGTALASVGRRLDALGEFREAIRLKPDDLAARTNLALALRSRGELEQAIGEFRELLRIKPDYVEAMNELGTTLREARQPDAAIAAYKQAVRIKPNFTAGLFNLAVTLAQQGKTAEAASHLRQAQRSAEQQGEKDLAVAIDKQLEALGRPLIGN